MLKIKTTEFRYSVLKDNGSSMRVYPYIRNGYGDKEMLCVSPLHGRSFVVGKEKGRTIVSKGNGLSYTQHPFLHTGEFYDGTWGLLLKQDAERDFLMGMEIEALGIKTNHMEYVIEIEKEVQLPNGKTLKPILLQYDVECPYRICDAAFMSHEQIYAEVAKWQKINEKGFDKAYMIAANVLIGNLRILHDHDVLHNAIHEQNYTWALELLDFELACSPNNPYSNEDDTRHVKDLFPREILQTYVIINYIANVLREEIDFEAIDHLFNNYGFDLNLYDTTLTSNKKTKQ